MAFTVTVTEWRTQFRRQMNELDSTAHSRAIDSLLNYETVTSTTRVRGAPLRQNLERYRRAALQPDHAEPAQHRAATDHHAVGLVAMLYRATLGVVEGRMTLGDLVMVNAFMIQLYIPLGFLGVLYREIKQA